MEFIKPGTKIDFMRYRLPVVGTSLVLVALSFLSLFVPGPNYGIDFAGGTEIQLPFAGEVTTDEIRGLLTKFGYARANVVNTTVVDEESATGLREEYILSVRETSALSEDQRTEIETKLTALIGKEQIRRLRISPGGDKVSLRLSAESDQDAIRDAIVGAGVEVRDVNRFGASDEYRYEAHLIGIGDTIVQRLQTELGERGPQSVSRIEWVGPQAGEQLRESAVKALVYVIIFIMLYVAFRFDLRFAPGGVLAMFHDALITLGIYVLVQKEINLTTVAALLTILGYSINDTIVVYDRIRENMGIHRDESLRSLINLSTSQMLSRTLVTSGTTLISVLAFFIWGTPVIQDIAFALFIGILVGTYSSIYIAAPVTEWMDRKLFPKKQKQKQKQTAPAKSSL